MRKESFIALVALASVFAGWCGLVGALIASIGVMLLGVSMSWSIFIPAFAIGGCIGTFLFFKW